MTEEWRPIDQWYDVSNLGRVRSWKTHRCRGRRTEPRILKLDTVTCGYPRVCLNGKVRLVHQLVLEAFVGQRPTPHMQGAHRDDNALNNRIDNLYWATPAENGADKARHGRSKGEGRRGVNKLTDEDVIRIREGEATAKEIAATRGVCTSHVYKVRAGKKWTHLPHAQT